MVIETSNSRKAMLLSKSKLDNSAIAELEGVNIRRAAEIRLLVEAKICELARSSRDDVEKWRVFKSQITRGRIPTEAYIILRMTEFGYKRIFELASREIEH